MNADEIALGELFPFAFEVHHLPADQLLAAAGDGQFRHIVPRAIAFRRGGLGEHDEGFR